MNRPIGITILAGLQFFYSGFGILVSLAILLIAPFRDQLVQTSMKMLESSPELAQSPIVSAEFFESMIKVGAVVGLVFSAIGLLLGYGLLKLKKWAWICTLVLQVLQVLSTLQAIVSVLGAGAMMPGLTFSQQAFQLLLSGLIIYYLFRPEVRRAFHRSNQSPGSSH